MAPEFLDSFGKQESDLRQIRLEFRKVLLTLEGDSRKKAIQLSRDHGCPFRLCRLGRHKLKLHGAFLARKKERIKLSFSDSRPPTPPACMAWALRPSLGQLPLQASIFTAKSGRTLAASGNPGSRRPDASAGLPGESGRHQGAELCRARATSSMTFMPSDTSCSRAGTK